MTKAVFIFFLLSARTIRAALCSGNAAKLQRLCSCLAEKLMLQRAAIPLCSACSAVHQFAAILQRQSVAVK